jgi:hypothetical protein
MLFRINLTIFKTFYFIIQIPLSETFISKDLLYYLFWKINNNNNIKKFIDNIDFNNQTKK